MDDVNLAKRSESRIVEFERKVLNLPLYHQLYVHGRSHILMMGLITLAFGVGMIMFLTSADRLVALICFLVGVVVELVMIGRSAIPCKCGKIPALTAKVRRGMLSLRNKGFVVMTSTIGSVIGISIFFLGFELLGQQLLMATGVVLVLCGLFCTFISAANKMDWFFKGSIIPEREQNEITGLCGVTEEELEKLTNFHLKSGNFSKADECSRKLLAFVENKQMTDPR